MLLYLMFPIIEQQPFFIPTDSMKVEKSYESNNEHK